VPAANGLTCSNCARTIREAEAEAAGWRYRSNGVGDLHVFCPACAVREFAPDATPSSEAVNYDPPLMRFIDVDMIAPHRTSWRWLRRTSGRSPDA